jgi:hypothetical protein
LAAQQLGLLLDEGLEQFRGSFLFPAERTDSIDEDELFDA